MARAEATTTGLGGMPVAAGTLVKRIGTTVVSVPLFVWLVLGGPAWLFAALVVALAAIASWELARMFQRAGRPAAPWLNVVTAALVAASFLLPPWVPLAVTMAVIAVMAAEIWRPGPPSIEPVVAGLLGVGYVGWLLGHGILLDGLPSGPALVLVLVGVTWVGESAAYGVGSTLGRHRLAPVISPGKTLEGAAAQLVASVIAALALGAWLLPEWSAATAALAGVLLGVAGQVGDLAESVLKRALGTKDTGAIIPGHGGVLDRLDSLLFNVAALYYLVVTLENVA